MHKCSMKIVQAAASQYGHVRDEILYLPPIVFMNLCQMEIYSVSHALIWPCVWWEFVQIATHPDTFHK